MHISKGMKRFLFVFLIFCISFCACFGYNSTKIKQNIINTQDCPNATSPTNNLPIHVDPASPLFRGDLKYRGGHVVDGKAKIYLIFWIDSAFHTASPQFVSLTEQFVQDIGQSPLYTNLSQYRDSQNRYPICAVLAGTFIDTQPFPANLVAAWKRGEGKADQDNKFTDPIWRNELEAITALQGWNTQDYHNIFVLLPVINWGACGYHEYLKSNTGQQGSPWAYIAYPMNEALKGCADALQSPNGDLVADITVDTLSHELLEAVTDPFIDGWTSPSSEIADKCQFITPAIVNPKTGGDVTWQGHTYMIQEEYDNLRHGCISPAL